MLTSAQSLQQLYIAYFNRPADPGGLAFWQATLERGVSLDTIAAAFAGSAEYQNQYAGAGPLGLLKTAYGNLFGRAPDAGGLKFWGDALASGALGIDQAVMGLLGGARGSDAAIIANKMQLASEFTAQLDEAHNPMASAAGRGLVRAWLGKVGEAGSLDAARSEMAKLMAGSAVTPEAPHEVQGRLSAVGFLSGATVFADANGDGIWNEGEARAVSDARGYFSLQGAKGGLVASGGTDLATQQAFSGVLHANAGATIVNPLTTLLYQLRAGGMDDGAAQAVIARSFGIDAKFVDLKQHDALGILFDGQHARGGAPWAPLALGLNALLTLASHTLVAAAGGPAALSLEQAGDAFLQALAAKLGTGGAQINGWSPLPLIEVLQNSVAYAGNASLSGAAAQLADPEFALNFGALALAAIDCGSAGKGFWRGPAFDRPGDTYQGLAHMVQNAAVVQSLLVQAVQDALYKGAPERLYTDYLSREADAWYKAVLAQRIGDLDPSSDADAAAIADPAHGRAPPSSEPPLPRKPGAPVLVARTSGEIGADEGITFTFNEAIQPGQNAHFYFQGEGAHPDPGNYIVIDADDRSQVTYGENSVTLRPMNGLPPGRSYVVSFDNGNLSKAVVDRDGLTPAEAPGHGQLATVIHVRPAAPGSLVFQAGSGEQAGTLYLSGNGRGPGSRGNVEVHLDGAQQTGQGKPLPPGGPYASLDAAALREVGVTAYAGASGVLNGSDQGDKLYAGSAGQYVLKGGKGGDELSGHAGSRTVYQFAASDFTVAQPDGWSWGNTDRIREWQAGDRIRFDGMQLHARAHKALETDGKASIEANGMAFFKEKDLYHPLTLEQKLNAIVNAVGGDDLGTAVVFNHENVAYVFVVGDARPGMQAGDGLFNMGAMASSGLQFDHGDIVGGFARNARPGAIITPGSGSEAGTLLISGDPGYNERRLEIHLDQPGQAVLEGGQPLAIAAGNYTTADASGVHTPQNGGYGNGLAMYGATSGLSTLIGSVNRDSLFARSGGETLLRGGGDDDRLVFEAGARVTALYASSDFARQNLDEMFYNSGVSEMIAGWTDAASARLRFDNLQLTTRAHGDVAQPGRAAISAGGVASFHASDLADGFGDDPAGDAWARLGPLRAKLKAVLAAVGDDAAGTTVAFEDQGDTLLFIVGDSRPGVQQGDALIRLQGVSVGAAGLQFEQGALTGGLQASTWTQPQIVQGSGEHASTLYYSGHVGEGYHVLDLRTHTGPATGTINSIDASAMHGGGLYARQGDGKGDGFLIGTDGRDYLASAVDNHALLAGGKGSDVLSLLHTGTIQFERGDFEASNAYDLLHYSADYVYAYKGELRFSDQALSVKAHAGPAQPGVASIDVKGWASFAGIDDKASDEQTLLAKINAVVAAVGNDGQGTTVMFRHPGSNASADTYFFVVGDAAPGIQKGDALIAFTSSMEPRISVSNGVIVCGIAPDLGPSLAGLF